MRPCVFPKISATARSTDPSSAKSNITGSNPSPCKRSKSAACRTVGNTRQPHRCKSCAVASPIPDDAPVTTTILSRTNGYHFIPAFLTTPSPHFNHKLNHPPSPAPEN